MDLSVALDRDDPPAHVTRLGEATVLAAFGDLVLILPTVRAAQLRDALDAVLSGTNHTP